MKPYIERYKWVRKKQLSNKDIVSLLSAHPKSPGYADLATVLIKQSGLFDAEYYLETNKDVKASGMDPLNHYVLYGGKEGRDPNPDFSGSDYLAQNAEVRETGVNPLLHYMLWTLTDETLTEKQATVKKRNEYQKYLSHQHAIKDTIIETDLELEGFFQTRVQPIIDKLLEANTQLVVYPLSYPLDVAQRPDHLFRYLSTKSIPTLIIESSLVKKPYIKKMREGVYVTNTFGPSLSYLKNKRTILYITYPFYSVVVPFLKPAKILYDVIDDLNCFSGSLQGLRADHRRLLKIADIIMYSSKTLLQKDENTKSEKSFLAENGVWIDDFADHSLNKQYSFRKNKETVIGYYGAVSNLLDWNLLERISAIENVRLVLIGPRADFKNHGTSDKSLVEKVLDRPNITYVETVKYSELPKYAAHFDAAIIPFLVNEITDSVSPLKLFEYMAAGKKIFATPTKTLLEYKDMVTVAAKEDLLQEIKKWNKQKDSPQVYSEVLRSADWSHKFNEPIAALLASKTPSDHFLAKQVDIVNVNFYDQKGQVLFKGGAERYVFDLAQILKQMGHHPRIIQNATTEFRKTYRGIEVVGVVTGIEDAFGTGMRKISKAYNNYCKDADLVIASPLDLACEITSVPVIGISHGIHWDNNRKRLSNNRSSDYGEVFDALTNITTGVCVDTNFINWTRTYDYSLGSKLRYIPNYYDSGEFKYAKKSFNGRLKVMFPRRLYDARGIYITLEAFNKLLVVYKEIDLLLVGQTTDPMVIKAVKEIIKKYPKQVTLEEYDMEDMHKAYEKSHVVLIPTMFAEGTSLSCLEAMATNNALIATNIGGLPNLVIDHYNGLLIDPSAKALLDAVESIIKDRSLAVHLAKNGSEMVKVFEKNNWDKRWKQLLEEEL